MKAYYVSGGNGSVLQLEDGRYADTVSGDTSESLDAHDALPLLEAIGTDWQAAPLFGDFDHAAMEEYCSVNKSGWGGPREGAGRPATLSGPVRLTITLEQPQVDWLAAQGPASVIIRDLIAREMAKSE